MSNSSLSVLVFCFHIRFHLGCVFCAEDFAQQIPFFFTYLRVATASSQSHPCFQVKKHFLFLLLSLIIAPQSTCHTPLPDLHLSSSPLVIKTQMLLPCIPQKTFSSKQATALHLLTSFSTETSSTKRLKHI